MGITKTEGFSPQTLEMAEIVKAIGHPARLAIMEYLAKSPSCICNDIIAEVPLAQPTISRHLSELKKVGLIKGRISGKNICYCIDPDRWQAVMEYLRRLSGFIESPAEKCNSSIMK